ncbi:MAG: hypothetical protein E7302_04325 [Butyrivibrio sp.]|jgi:hypothetical protein|nr:hypothetical protein [Butyrivibrio sp.]
MRTKKFLAITMAVTMMVGSSLTAFAADANGATGTGTNTGHLDTDVYTAVLPTDTAIADFFNFTIDPENILATADKFTDGSTAAGADFANKDLVYFKQASGATKAYASTSQAAEVGAKNYADVDVSVEATIGAAADGKTIIPMVSTADELTAATTPSLFLQLKVGTKTVPVTATGASTVEKITGQPTNFDTKYDSASGGYKLAEKESVTWTNNTAGVQLIGKVKGGEVATNVVAPIVTLTWSVGLHSDSYLSESSVAAGADRELTMTLPDGVTVTGMTITKTAGTTATGTSGTHYVVSGNKLTLKNVAATWASVTIKYSDNHTDTVTVTSN